MKLSDNTMKLRKLTLPEFTFIDHIGYDDPEMKGRTIIMHIRTATLMELVSVDDEVAFHPEILNLHV